MCGLRQLAGAGTNWKFLLSPRPIKLRVNLAPLIIAAGASPFKKGFLQQAICSTRRTGYYYIKRIITFLICAKEEQENPVKVIVEKTKISWRESLRLMQTLSTRCIFSYSDYNKNTRATIFSPTLFCPGLKMDPGQQKVCPGQCIWEELLVFEVPATVNNRFDIQTRTMLLFAASFFGKKSSK